MEARENQMFNIDDITMISCRQVLSGKGKKETRGRKHNNQWFNSWVIIYLY